MNLLRRPLVLLPYAIAVVATAAAVHLATILLFPGRAREHDAFARVAALTVPGVLTPVRAARDRATLPVRDGAMDLSLCRYDLGTGPLRITVDPFDEGFLSIGMHGRSGVTFYGLNLTAGDRYPIAMVLTTAAEASKAGDAEGEDEPRGDLRIVAPEPEGFVTIEVLDTEPTVALATLDHVHCGPDDPPRHS